jgi:asparagine N-glycosylation enzyme membrane subunit Stt3
MSLILTALIAFVSIMVPGFFLALALLKKTKLNMFEITVIGFIFGLIFPPTLTWLESYLMNYVHAFSFSAGLYAANVVVLTIVGILLSLQQGAISLDFLKSRPRTEVAAKMNKDYKERIAELRATVGLLNTDIRLIKEHEREEEDLAKRHEAETLSLRAAGPEERAKIEEMHRAEERKLIEQHEKEERLLLEGKNAEAHAAKKEKGGVSIVYLALLLLMLVAFGTRMLSIGITPKFFEFDPYFDMQSTEFLLIHGYQWLYDTSAWPTAIIGTPHRIEPIVPYIEAYWYQLSSPPASAISHTLLSDVSGVYPPITAALLVFIVFLFLYHTYGEKPAIIGAILATAMPTLISTFIAGEQLVEPWGIFSMFFFYAAYLLAAQNPKDRRLAILAGIAFASTFLGAHYYTVDAGVLAAYIVLQGVINVLRKEEMKDFYVMNLIVTAMIILFYLPFGPYGSVLANAIPDILGVPVIIAFPLLALALVAVFEYVPLFAKKMSLLKKTDITTYLGWLVVIGILGVVLIAFTPVGTPVDRYLALSSHYTTPSTALFMTVQEYEPTGFNFDFGNGGFGLIGASVLGVNILVWGVLALFVLATAYAVYKRNSKGSILALVAVLPLAVAAMIEVKYLPHFGVGYIIAIGAILGELFIFAKDRYGKDTERILFLFALAVMILLSVASVVLQSESIGYTMFDNVVPNSWLQATAWMSANVGPYAPRILSWWDYGDWINWFGNSNAVLRGDNSIAKLDYETAARYVLGSADGYGPQNLANFSDSIQAKYVLFDDQLTQKWQALDFLACVDTNQTSRQFAIQAAQKTSSPYELGTSQCEQNHDPAQIFVPMITDNIGSYCQIPGSNASALKGFMVIGGSLSNQTFCIPLNKSTSWVRLLTPQGKETNVVLSFTQQFYEGTVNVSGEDFASFIPLYLPNGPNDTITNAPTEFYESNYYRGFYLGELPGFKMVYPSNFTGINYVNGTWPVVIYQVDNYTGGLPNVTAKPSWIQNNFTMPG